MNVFFKTNVILSSLFNTFIIKLLVAFGGILLSIIISNLYGVHVLGEYFIFQMFVITSSVIISLGFNETLVLFVSKFRFQLRVERFLYLSLFIATLLLLLVFFLYVFLGSFISWPTSYEIISANIYLYFISLFINLVSLILSGYFRGLKKPVMAVFLENGFVSIILILIVLINYKLQVFIVNSVTIITFYTIALFVVLVISLLINKLTKKERPRLSQPEKKYYYDFVKRSKYFYIIVISGLVSTTLIALYLGAKLTPSDVALFKVLQQIAVLVSFSLIVLNAVLPAHYSSFKVNNNYHEMEKTAKLTSKYATLLSLPFYLACIFFPEALMYIFGDGFSNYSIPLLILATGQLFNVSTGSVASILKMCNFESYLSYIVLLTSFVSLIMLYILTPLYGVVGAAVSLSSIYILQNLLATILVVKLIGISPLFYLNIKVRRNEIKNS